MTLARITTRVFRYDPLVDSAPRYREYSVPGSRA